MNRLLVKSQLGDEQYEFLDQAISAKKSTIDEEVMALTSNPKSQIERNFSTLKKKLLSKQAKFIDTSRSICCCFTTAISVCLMLTFYCIDYLKSQSKCESNNGSFAEFCDSASAISFWTKFTFFLCFGIVISISLYCTGNTEVWFDPARDSMIVNKKKLLFLPSSMQFAMADVNSAVIESDLAVIDGPKIATFNFYSIAIYFKNGSKLNLGFGRDCFSYHKKAKLVNDINEYLRAVNLAQDST